MRNWKKLHLLIGLLLISALVLTACPAPAPAGDSGGDAAAEDAGDNGDAAAGRRCWRRNYS